MLTVKNSTFDLPCTIGFAGEQFAPKVCRSSSTPPALNRTLFSEVQDSFASPLPQGYDSTSETKDTQPSQSRDVGCCMRELEDAAPSLSRQPAVSDCTACYGPTSSTAENIVAWGVRRKLAESSHIKQAVFRDEWTKKTWTGHKGEQIEFKPHGEEGVWTYTSTLPSGRKKQACLTLDVETGFVWQKLHCTGSYYFNPQETDGGVIKWYRSDGSVSAISWQAQITHSPELSQPMFVDPSARRKRAPRRR